MPLPVGLRPPLGVALARPAGTVPAEDALPGGARYEPKWDGFRLLLVVDDEDVTLWSRQGKNLTRAFPELVAAAAQLPSGVILDGEAVVWSDDRLDFDALLRRTNGSSSTVAKLSRAQPASYVAFDILAIADRDARALRLDDRRALLEELAREWSPPLNLSPVTADAAEAAQWFDTLVASGVEGLVVKGGAQPYVGGDRTWVKVKHRDTLDVICAAVIGARERPEELVIGLPIDGELRIVGRSTTLATSTARELGRLLREPAEPHPWPQEVKPGALSRFNRSGREPVRLTLVQPFVVEIAADVAMTGRSFRHVVRFLRARPDVPVAEVEASR
ncbi:ATP-dependent DNA ligase [Microbacterium sp. As-52]|uniref:ATP-dependent DNA ligase n=1 Tax=Microbacterium sp. As-52 TaxID=3390503 RepID=UPI003CF75F7D